jgi:hypothetical protein
MAELCFGEERAVHTGPARCWSRIASALVTSSNGGRVAVLSETDVVVLDALGSLQPMLKLDGLCDVRCAALSASHMVIVEGAQWRLFRFDAVGKASVLFRESLLYAAADVDVLERAMGTLVLALAGPCGVSLLLATQGNAAPPKAAVTLFKRSSVVCVKFSPTHVVSVFRRRFLADLRAVAAGNCLL